MPLPDRVKKRIAFIVIGSAIVFGLAIVCFVMVRYVPGVWPAIAPPAGDIAADIEQATTPSTPSTSSTLPVPKEAVPSFPLQMPAGVSVRVYTKGLDTPRDLELDPRGRVLVSELGKGTVEVLVEQADGTTKAKTILSKLEKPHGLSFACEDDEPCYLFVAQTTSVHRYEYDAETMTVSHDTKILDLPAGGRHFTRSLFAHDGKLFISIGSSCDVCRESDERYASVMVSDFDGNGAHVYAKGLRNPVFIAHHPVTHQLWVTEMGRDNLGDNLPPDEINVLKADGNYGWPNCYGGNVHDTAFDKNTYIRNPCMEPFETPAHIELPAHSAPLGLAFFPKEWPAEYRNDLLLAFHGSWNRSAPTGYKLERIDLDDKGNEVADGQTDFISGWLNAKNQALGRPVDVLFRGKDLFVSDDKAGIIYRFSAP